MDENQIGFAWGGCGNLITYCLKSNSHYDLICDYYTNIHLADTWTNQEWNIRHQIGLIKHCEPEKAKINLAWKNSLDTSFHYLIKNIVVNHLSGSMIDKINGVIDFNQRFEGKARSRNCVFVDDLLVSTDSLYRWCISNDPSLDKKRIDNIYNMWIAKTKLFYEKNSKEVLTYFESAGIDYSPTTIYNILYENSNIRQQQF